MDVDQMITRELRRLLADLISGEYLSIEADGRAGELTALDIDRAISEYGGQLTQPPAESFEKLDMIPVTVEAVPTFYLDFELWVDGRRSDLTVSCTVVVEEGGVSLTIDNIHVL